jgi:hypothetical protein
MLRATGVAIGLPLLDAMLPLGLGAEAKAAKLVPRRMVLISRPLGAHASFLFPEKAGMDYESTRYLKLLDDHRGRFTLFAGLSHPGHAHHHSEPGLFTGVAGEFIRSDKDLRNTISLDVLAAEQVGRETRFPRIGLGGAHSFNRKGVRMPSLNSAEAMFRQLFVDGTPDEIAREVQRLRDGRSILDGVRQQARDLARNLGAGDRERLDTLLTSIREAEERLTQDEAWVNKPKPKVQYQTREFREKELVEKSRQWFDLIHLALQTDSTRVINLHIHSHGQVNVEGVNMEHHEASHHGQDAAKIEQLAKVEEAEYRVFNFSRSCTAQAKEMKRCSIARWSSTEATSGTHRLTHPRICRSSSQGAASSTPGTCSTTARRIVRSQTSSCGCFIRWALRPTSLARARAW